jgi:hypothetical protein
MMSSNVLQRHPLSYLPTQFGLRLSGSECYSGTDE